MTQNYRTDVTPEYREGWDRIDSPIPCTHVRGGDPVVGYIEVKAPPSMGADEGKLLVGEMCAACMHHASVVSVAGISLRPRKRKP